ncbi:DEAD/DEAH box helicase [Pelotomaculum sp. FP]|uniref:DEAD/DEAH box helicase n=1 Tax=Pelotomaculum sp. FP TaxID=261474 RepID=UPI0010667988|nr:DEAD/DEAH box helicase [Pelotomaculum sp. FP]TEB11621.1 DEAD/DEAH box helicase [Pelotomaculum sp. FP]
MIPIAHSARGGRPAQSYRDHICGVIEKVKGNLEALAPHIAKEKAELYSGILNSAAAFHDVGKLAGENQDVLYGRKQAKRLPIEHRDAGVKYLLGDKPECPEVTLVYSHHRPGLPDMYAHKVADTPFRFLTAMSDTDKNLCNYLRIHVKEIGELPEPTDRKAVKLSALEYRILLSCLVDADHSDTAGELLIGAEPRWEERRLRLDRYVQNLQGRTEQDSERNHLRTLLYQICKGAATDAVMEYCDSPVGTGKTTAVMAHMLKTAQAHHLRHIFVVLPYTNIISQTVEVLRKAVVLDGEDPEEVVAEHHHQADFEDPEYRRLATTWTAPIIVTTAVQFFETLAGNLPAKLRKLQQLPGSGIIFDEYHAALPVGLMLPAWKWITELASQWRCRICMCSATTVKFWESPAFQKQDRLCAVPLLPLEVSESLNAFEQSRVDLNAWSGNIPHFYGAVELAAYLNNYHGSKIVVLDTVQSAAAFAKFLHQQGYDVLHLSSALTPEDRERTIAKIERRLCSQSEFSKDWTLVATSCVECGMDFSFRCGFCELRSLQSYIQLSGRIRRNSEREYEDAVLVAFTITEDNFTVDSSFNDSKSVFRKMISSGRLSAVSVTEAVTEAFRQECKMRGALSEEICKADRLHEFETVAKKFRVIDEETVTVVASPTLATKIQAGEQVSAKELQRGSVNLRKSVLARLGLPDSELPMLSDLQYDAFLGYMKSLI